MVADAASLEDDGLYFSTTSFSSAGRSPPSSLSGSSSTFLTSLDSSPECIEESSEAAASWLPLRFLGIIA
jgi:hypothetical protein